MKRVLAIAVFMSLSLPAQAPSRSVLREWTSSIVKDANARMRGYDFIVERAKVVCKVVVVVDTSNLVPCMDIANAIKALKTGDQSTIDGGMELLSK